MAQCLKNGINEVEYELQRRNKLHLHPRVIEDRVVAIAFGSRIFLVNIDTPHFAIISNLMFKSSPVKLSFLWATYIVIVIGNDTVHRCDYLGKA